MKGLFRDLPEAKGFTVVDLLTGQPRLLSFHFLNCFDSPHSVDIASRGEVGVAAIKMQRNSK